ncbi:MAG: hypothetical protein H7Y07_00805 [Pyrinomonadaceae bacterium]|nr:hypothetical protein [Sphingobacteriaceae bacterium]
MKQNIIFRITILCAVVLTVVSFTTLPQQKGKNEKGDKSQGQSNDNEKGQQKGNDSYPEENKNQGNKENHKNPQKNDDQNDHGKQNKNSDHGQKHDGMNNSDKMKNMDNDDHAKMKHGNGNSKSMNGKRDVDVDWNITDFKNRKNPKDQKKVSVCHNPTDGDEKNGVTINISENAVKAHMAHGDKLGNCTIDYGDRWSKDYVKSRENVYNAYEQTWERMSYGEALVRLAAQKILGLQTNLTTTRATLSPVEIQRREALILELQSNSVALDTQVGGTRQRLDNDVNIIIKL